MGTKESTQEMTETRGLEDEIRYALDEIRM